MKYFLAILSALTITAHAQPTLANSDDLALKVDDSQLSTTGGANKIPQLDAYGNLYLQPLVNDAVAVTEEGGTTGNGGDLIMRNQNQIGWWSLDNSGGDTGYIPGAGHEYAKIRYDRNHPPRGEWNFDSAGRVCWYWKHGFQMGNAEGGTHFVYFPSGNASALTTTRQAVANYYTTATWNGSASVQNIMGMQAAPLDTTGTNSAFQFFGNTTGHGDSQIVSGTKIAEIAPAGVWSNGTAPQAVGLTDGATITQTCSKYKTAQVGRVTLGGNRTLAISGAIAGMRGILYVSQDTTGSRTLTLPAGSVKETGGWSLSTGIELTDILKWEFDGTNYFWTITKGFSVAYAATDADAIAYIAAVEAAKGSVTTGGQKLAIDNFIIAEKAASRWTSHKRIIFPIWANAGANAIDMKTLATGTFVNSPTQGNGFIQGNGSTQYFDVGATASALGMTLSSAGVTLLMPENTTATGSPFGSNSGGGQFGSYYYSGGGQLIIGGAASVSPFATSDRLGIFCSNRVGTAMTGYRRKTAGFETLVSDTVASSQAIPTLQNVYLMAASSTSAPANYWNGKIGAFAIHSGFGSSDASAFTSNLKTLWETCTGLTLP